MSEKKIAAFLKQLRKTSGYSASKVVDKLKDYDIDISAKTLYGYEGGISMLNADTFIALCRIYRCDNPMDIFDTISLGPDEISMVEKYRLLDKPGKEAVDWLLDHETERMDAIDKLRDRHAAMRIYTYMHKIAAAGTGFYFDDIPTDTIEAPYRENADFIIGVSGDSMEPTYKDGDLVYVEKCQIVHTGDVGIFIVNNELYIKEAGESGLISHNSKYDPIPGSENILCVGKVLGKVNAD